MVTMEECIADEVSAIIALTEDETRDVEPIMADIRRCAEAIRERLEQGDPE